MAQKNKGSENGTNANTATEGKEPSLGPACGFFFILFCVVLSISLIGLSWWMGGRENQNMAAAKAIRGQLIPWIEDSTLSEQDRLSMVERLEEFLVVLDAKQMPLDQLQRLSFRLNSAPIFQWGVIEAIQAQAQANPDLSAEEKASIEVNCDRLLRATLESKIAMEQLSFVVQKVATTERLSLRLNLRPENTADDLREFWRRAESVCDRLEVSREPLHKSPSQVFRMMMDEAMAPPKLTDSTTPATQK